MKSLFALTEDFEQLEILLDRLDDEGANAIEETSRLLEWMNQLSNERAEKIDAYCWIIKRLDSERDTARKIAEEFRQKAHAREAKIDMLKSMMFDHMKRLNHIKLFGKAFTVAIQKNGGSIPVMILDENEVPDQYCHIVREPIKTNIRIAIEQGVNVPGAVLGERGESLRIK